MVPSSMSDRTNRERVRRGHVSFSLSHVRTHMGNQLGRADATARMQEVERWAATCCEPVEPGVVVGT